MAKHPVPKQKQSKTRSGRRYKTYANKARKRLMNLVKGQKHRLKNAPEEQKKENVTTIQA